MTITLGINGFGRIGRCTLSHLAQSARNDVKVVRMNATGPIDTAAHLIRYDSVHGRFPGPVKVEGDTIDLGQGPMELARPLAPDIWLVATRRSMDAPAPGDWTLRLERDQSGRITGAELGCWLARGIPYRRVE